MRTQGTRKLSLGVLVLASVAALVALSPRSAAKTTRVSEVIDITKPYSVIAALPDVPGFIAKLRSGDEMRAFFDSPLGLHLLRSAPSRSAAHLHRLISYTPRSWQWNLYTLISDGPVFYRSAGGKFVLVVSLNRKGMLATSFVDGSNVQKVDNWLLIASDKAELAAAVQYLQKPATTDSPLDAMLAGKTALAFDFNLQLSGKRSLVRGLFSDAFGSEALTRCTVALIPGANSIQIDGTCPLRSPATAPAGNDETLTLADYPAFAYFHKPGQKLAHVLSLNGFATDYGYMIPQLLFSGPLSDQKSIEFLSQAFKTKAHKLESAGGAIQIRYPYAYSYEKRKFDVFSPHLAADRERFVWQSFLPEKNPVAKSQAISGKYTFFARVKLYPLLRNSQQALKQYDAIYSPGHFNEFRDALAKSAPTLKGTSLQIYTQTAEKSLRIGGSLSFGEDS